MSQLPGAWHHPIVSLVLCLQKTPGQAAGNFWQNQSWNRKGNLQQWRSAELDPSCPKICESSRYSRPSSIYRLQLQATKGAQAPWIEQLCEGTKSEQLGNKSFCARYVPRWIQIASNGPSKCHVCSSLSVLYSNIGKYCPRYNGVQETACQSNNTALKSSKVT